MRGRRLVVIILILIALAAAVCVGGGQLAANLVQRTQQGPTPAATTGAAPHLRAQGEVVPAHWVEIGFARGGVLAEGTVTAGQAVKAGSVVARLDPEPFANALRAAQADLEVARAQLEKLTAGPSPTELTLAQLEIAQAEAELKQLTAGPPEAELAAALGAVQAAERDLENARQDLIVVQKSDVVAKNVRDREYEHNWFEANYGEYKEKFERGEIDQTRLDLEWNALLTAKERLDSARAEAALALGTANARVAQAGENLRLARADLAELQRGPDAEQVAVAELAVQRAQAQWEQLTTEPDPASLKQAEAAVQAAEVALQEAGDDLEDSVLTAPFDGTIVAIDASPGEVVGTTPFVTLADLTTWQVETLDVDEWAAARIGVGQTVELTFPAFDDRRLAGTVASIAPRAEQEGGSDAFYTVVVTLGQPAGTLPAESLAGFRWGMTVRLDFGEVQ